MSRLNQLAKPWKSKDPEYRAYMYAQAEKTQRAMKGGPITRQRVTNLIGMLVRADQRSPLGRSALCIGARSTHEMQVLHAAGFGPVVGIDLLSQDPQIKAMDMHAMSFPDQLFDVVFSCHSLEHAYDLDVALKEWARVTAPGGTWAIEMPVRFPTTTVDRIDVGSKEALLERMQPYVAKVLMANDSQTRGVVQVIVEVNP